MVRHRPVLDRRMMCVPMYVELRFTYCWKVANSHLGEARGPKSRTDTVVSGVLGGVGA